MKKTALSTPIKGWLADQHGNNDNMAKVYSSVISSATENVSMLPFMPAMTDSVFNLIKDATDRGVEINMLIPQDPRAGLASCSRYLTKTYQDLGVHIYFEDFGDEIPPFLHEKLVVVDSRYVLFGSSNFNFRSMDLSNEVVLVADSEQFAQSIQQHFDGLLSHSREVSADKAQEWRTFNNFLLSIMMYIGG